MDKSKIHFIFLQKWSWWSVLILLELVVLLVNEIDGAYLDDGKSRLIDGPRRMGSPDIKGNYHIFNICWPSIDKNDLVPRCIPTVTSDESKSGNFTSPNYPRYYPQNTHCRYDFVGHANERVQIVFTDFNLFHPEDGFTHGRDSDKVRGYGEIERKMGNGRNLDCSGSDVDVLSAFVYNMEKLARIDDFCGSTPPLAIMSNGNRLTLEFKAPSSSSYVRGFSALYRFVTDFGISNGKQDPNVPCRFYFNSNETSNGTFTSPNYPGYYPRDTECHYFFQGKDNEHVELHFTYFHIDGVQPCDEETYSDYVEFSNYIPTDRKYDRKCGTESGFKVRSDRKFFRVNFHSNDRYDATGFQATYQFSDKINQMTIRNVRSSSASAIKFVTALENLNFLMYFMVIILWFWVVDS